MKPLIMLLAWRYLSGTAYEKNISTMVYVCFIALFIGSFSLTLVTAIMRGFEIAIHEKMQGIHAQITLSSPGNNLDVSAITDVLQTEFPQVLASSPYRLQHVIVTDEQLHENLKVAIMKGINPAQEALTTTLEQKIIHSITGENNLSSILVGNNILIGDKCAQELGLSLGDTVDIFYTDYETATQKKLTLESFNATIGGIFHTGIDEFDHTLMFGTLERLQQIFDDSITHIQLTLKSDTHESTTISQLKKRFDLEVYSWKDLYQPLVAALALEKYVSFCIIALITLVASMNIISLLFMQIVQKRPDIAILKALGMPHASITQLFIMMGMTIGLSASICGIACACIVDQILNHYPCITLPDAYYVSHLPSHLEWHIVITVFVLIIIITFLSSWIPVQRIRTINIAQVLRFEG